jgi:hypothetical protein
MSATEVAGIVALCGTAVSVAALVYLHLAPTGLSPVRHPVSQYGISPYRVWYRVQTVAMGLAALALAAAMGDTFLRGAHRPWGPPAAQVVVLVAAFAVSRLAISWFPMDAPGSPRTTTGAVHGVLALVTFLAVAAGAIRLCRVLDPVAIYDRLGNASRVLGWLMVACVALMLLARLAIDLRRAFGLVERALYVLIVAWLVLVGVAFATGHLGVGVGFITGELVPG